MVDPVGTGFSRAVGKGEGKQFWGVDNDIRSVSDFIVRYLGEYQRWASPKFVLGESYGGIRTAGVSYDLLTRHNVALNGIILVSPFLDFREWLRRVCPPMRATRISFPPTPRPRGITRHSIPNRRSSNLFSAKSKLGGLRL